MRVKTIVLASVATAAALVVTAVAILSQTDFNAYRGLIADEVRGATGRELAISGDLKLAVSLVPAVAVENVALANASWGSRPDMMRLQRLEAEIALVPALWGEIRVKRVRLVAPEILLETDPAGRGNWEFGPMAAPRPGVPPVAAATPAAKPAGGAPALPTIDEVEIREARITFRDGKTGETRALALDSATLKAESATAPLQLVAAGRVDNMTLAIKGTLGPMAVLQRPGTPYPINVEIKAGEATARVDGVVREPLEGKGFELAVVAEAPEVGNLGALAGIAVPALGPLKLAFTASDAGGSMGRSLGLAGIKAEIGRPELLRATVEGTVADVLKPAGIAVALGLRTDRLEALGSAIGKPLPLTGRLDLSVKAASPDGRSLSLTDLKLTHPAIDLSGEVSLGLGPPLPKLIARLASTRVDLASLTKPAETAASPAPSGPKPPVPASRDGRVFPNDPLPLVFLALIDADIAYEAGEVTVGSTKLSRLTLAATVESGVLKVSRFAVEAGGGKADGTLTVTAASRTVTGWLEAKGVELGTLLKETGSSDLLTGGRTDLSADLKGQGGSVREIMAGLDGSVMVATGRGRIANRYLNLAGGDLLRAVAPLLGGGDSTALTCAVSRFDIRGGIATTRVALVETDKVTIASAGTINLKTEALDLMASPRPKDAALLSVAVPAQIRGTLARPAVELDYGAAARKAAEATLGTVLLGPVGLLAPLISGGERDSDACAAAKAKAGLGPAGPAGVPAAKSAPDAKSAPPAKGGGIGGAFEDLGRGVKGLIGR